MKAQVQSKLDMKNGESDTQEPEKIKEIIKATEI